MPERAANRPKLSKMHKANALVQNTEEAPPPPCCGQARAAAKSSFASVSLVISDSKTSRERNCGDVVLGMHYLRNTPWLHDDVKRGSKWPKTAQTGDWLGMGQKMYKNDPDLGITAQKRNITDQKKAHACQNCIETGLNRCKKA